MDFETYRYIHYAGLFTMFLGLGMAIACAKNSGGGKPPGTTMAALAHGIGLAIAIVAGFGMAAKGPYASEMPNFVWAKLGIALAFGGWIAVIRRTKLPAILHLIILAALGLGAVYIAKTGPSW